MGSLSHSSGKRWSSALLSYMLSTVKVHLCPVQQAKPLFQLKAKREHSGLIELPVKGCTCALSDTVLVGSIIVKHDPTVPHKHHEKHFTIVRPLHMQIADCIVAVCSIPYTEYSPLYCTVHQSTIQHW